MEHIWIPLKEKPEDVQNIDCAFCRINPYGEITAINAGLLVVSKNSQYTHYFLLPKAPKQRLSITTPPTPDKYYI